MVGVVLEVAEGREGQGRQAMEEVQVEHIELDAVVEEQHAEPLIQSKGEVQV